MNIKPIDGTEVNAASQQIAREKAAAIKLQSIARMNIVKKKANKWICKNLSGKSIWDSIKKIIEGKITIPEDLVKPITVELIYDWAVKMTNCQSPTSRSWAYLDIMKFLVEHGSTNTINDFLKLKLTTITDNYYKIDIVLVTKDRLSDAQLIDFVTMTLPTIESDYGKRDLIKLVKYRLSDAQRKIIKDDDAKRLVVGMLALNRKNISKYIRDHIYNYTEQTITQYARSLNIPW